MEKETKLYNFNPKVEHDEIDINTLIDALFDIRLTLSIKRITSPTIKREELQKIINNTKTDKDIAVKNAIDDVFEEYLGKEKVSSSRYTLSDIDRIIDEKVKYVQTNEPKDRKLVMNNNYINQVDKAA